MPKPRRKGKGKGGGSSSRTIPLIKGGTGRVPSSKGPKY